MKCPWPGNPDPPPSACDSSSKPERVGSRRRDRRLGEKARSSEKVTFHKSSTATCVSAPGVSSLVNPTPADTLKCQPQIFQCFTTPGVPCQKNIPVVGWHDTSLALANVTGAFASPELFRFLSPGGNPLHTHTRSFLSFVPISPIKFSLIIGNWP